MVLLQCLPLHAHSHPFSPDPSSDTLMITTPSSLISLISHLSLSPSCPWHQINLPKCHTSLFCTGANSSATNQGAFKWGTLNREKKLRVFLSLLANREGHFHGVEGTRVSFCLPLSISQQSPETYPLCRGPHGIFPFCYAVLLKI